MADTMAGILGEFLREVTSLSTRTDQCKQEALVLQERELVGL